MKVNEIHGKRSDLLDFQITHFGNIILNRISMKGRQKNRLKKKEHKANTTQKTKDSTTRTQYKR